MSNDVKPYTLEAQEEWDYFDDDGRLRATVTALADAKKLARHLRACALCWNTEIPNCSIGRPLWEKVMGPLDE